MTGTQASFHELSKKCRPVYLLYMESYKAVAGNHSCIMYYWAINQHYNEWLYATIHSI